jgi:hypothetical protein
VVVVVVLVVVVLVVVVLVVVVAVVVLVVVVAVVDGPSLELEVAPEVVGGGRLVVEVGGVVVVGTIKVVVGRVAGGRVVPGRPRSAVSSASDVAVRGRSTPRERLRRPTGSAQAVARLRRQPSGWVSAQVWTESGARRLPPSSTRRLTARIRTAWRRGASIRWRAYPHDRIPSDRTRWSQNHWISDGPSSAYRSRQSFGKTVTPFRHRCPDGDCQPKGIYQ